mmetsp:Transcript_96752/g.282876  ORF Transcript_96752/g.282876 Transcript_96752/m.282876 type:complete len:105 (-) Transcript_96752:1523-1837(-)
MRTYKRRSTVRQQRSICPIARKKCSSPQPLGTTPCAFQELKTVLYTVKLMPSEVASPQQMFTQSSLIHPACLDSLKEHACEGQECLSSTIKSEVLAARLPLTVK